MSNLLSIHKVIYIVIKYNYLMESLNKYIIKAKEI